MNIGELFVALGFDVDDGKLKEFNEKVVAGRNELLKISAVATGAVYALNAFAEQSVNNAIAIRNLTNEVGANGEAVSRWQALVRATNPAMSADDAIASYKRLSDYLRDASLGKGAGSLNMLGVNYFNGMTNEQAIAQIKAALPGAEQRFSKSQISGFLTDILGTSGVLNALRMTDSEAERLTAGRFRTQAQIDELAKLGDKLNDVSIQWDNFKTRMTAQWAPSAITEIDRFQQKIQELIPTFNHVMDAMNTWEKVGAAILTYYTVTWATGMLGVIARVAGGLVGLASAGIGAGVAGLGAGAAVAYYSDKWLGWGQAFADIVAPVQTPESIRANLRNPGGGIRDVDQFMNPVNVPANNNNVTSTNSLTQHINSSADAQTIGEHAARLWSQEQQRRDSGIYIQLNQGPNY